MAFTQVFTVAARALRRSGKVIAGTALATAMAAGLAAPAQAQAQPAMPQVPTVDQLLQGFQLPPAPQGQQAPLGSQLPPAPQLPTLEDLGVPVPPGSSIPGVTTKKPSAKKPSGQQASGNRTLTNVPSRTSMAVITSNGSVIATANANDARPGLSIVKLYLADYVLRQGDRSKGDRYLAEQMIRFSSDGAASKLSKKYPGAINATAREYGLGNTWEGATWGTSYTSAMDTARYLNRVKQTRPNSLILRWMRNAGAVATDGTNQNWGTANLPGVTGTKWGWSDYGATTVASASIANNYTAAAFTNGGRGEQNVDVRSAIVYLPR